MADVKWIKITTDMFDNRKIRHLRRLPDGNSIVLIWVMLLTMAGRCNASGMIFLTDTIPYTTKMLADELGFEENTVKLALSALEQLGMVTTSNTGFFAITDWEEHQNVEGMDKIREQNRIRKQRQRANAELPDSVCHVTVTQCHATDKEEEIDIDNTTCANDYTKTNHFEDFWKAYPKKKAKGDAEKAWKALKPNEETFDKILGAIESQKKTQQWQKENGQFIPYPATWLRSKGWEDEDAQEEKAVIREIHVKQPETDEELLRAVFE